jgi:hypothetical protein
LQKAVIQLILCFLGLGLFLPFAGIASTEVISTGKGAGREEAIDDALRNAVEKAAGVIVYSVSEVQNYRLVSDKIAAASRGYVRDYRIVSETRNDNLIFLTAAVTVDSEAIKTRLRNESKAVLYDDVLKDYHAVKQQQASLNKIANLLQTLGTRPLGELYAAEYTGYEITDVEAHSSTVGIRYRIRLNPFFWDTYYKALALADDTGSTVTTCLDYKLASVMGNYYYRGVAHRIHPDIERYTVKPRTATILVDFAGSQYRVPGFRLYETVVSTLYNLTRFPVVNERTGTCEIGSVSEKMANAISIIPEEGKEFITRLTVADTDVLRSLARVKITLREE